MKTSDLEVAVPGTRKLPVRAGPFSFAAMILTLASPARTLAAGTTIDFESFPNPQPLPKPGFNALDTQYGSLGVIFAYNDSTLHRVARLTGPGPLTGIPSPHNNSGHLALGPDYSQENDSDFVVTFRSPQSLVSLYGGTGCNGALGVLQAFAGPSGGAIATDSHPLVGGATSVAFSVGSASGPALITRISFKAQLVGSDCMEAIDDLHFEGSPPPPVPAPPTIVLSAPQPGTHDHSSGSVHVIGAVSGTELVNRVQVDLVFLDTPSGVPTLTGIYPFLDNNANFSTPGGANLPFDGLLSEYGLAIGNYHLVATVRDLWGQEAQVVVDFFNSPGGTPDPALGTFKYSVADINCQLAFYQNGVVAIFPGNSPPPRSIPQGIADKWLTVNSQILGANGSLGCPLTSGATTVASNFSAGNWQLQDFERGRVYLPTTGAPRYVPTILTDAIRVVSHFDLGGLSDELLQVGWPVSDPTYVLDSDDPVWVFQRFAQNDLGPAYRNTIEIRGRAPRMFVERVGGDRDETAQAFRVPQGGATPTVIDARTPTHWRDFPCNKSASDRWPTTCDLSTHEHPDMAGNYIPIDNMTPGHALAAEPFCGNSPVNCDCSTFGTCQSSLPINSVPMWSDVDPTNKNRVNVGYSGVIRFLDEVGPNPGSHLAGEDYPPTHDNCNMTTGGFLSDLGSLLATITVCAGTFNAPPPSPADPPSLIACDEAAGWTKDNIGRSCRSDWNLHTRPLPRHNDWGFLAVGNIVTNTDFEIEFEVAWASAYFDRFTPVAGDLVNVHGRQIVDCAHCDPFKTEIHPPDALLVSRSFVSQPYSNLDPIRTTDAYVWVNAFLPGAFLVGFTVLPPPRPSATAKMVVLQHESGYFQSNLEQASVAIVPTGVQMSFLAANAVPQETSDGQFLLPNTGVRYVDNLQITWTQDQQ